MVYKFMLLLGQLITLILAIILIIWLVRTIRTNPNFLSGENWNKSFFSMGILALLLIGFIALTVVWLRLS